MTVTGKVTHDCGTVLNRDGSDGVSRREVLDTSGAGVNSDEVFAGLKRSDALATVRTDRSTGDTRRRRHGDVVR